MQDGAAVVLKQQLASNASTYDSTTRAVLQDALSRLISRDPVVAWTSGQWMTERGGGSDVSGTETRATFVGSPAVSEVYSRSISGESLPLGPWRIDGFKWFSSATDSGMALLLAKTIKGLSCFFAPTRRMRAVCRLNTDTLQTAVAEEEFNGIHIQRLKSKFGTRAVPTAELELEGMQAYLLGAEGEGIKVISGMLSVTRVHNAVTAVSLLGRGLGVVRAYASVRKVGGGMLLRDVPLFCRTVAATVVPYRAAMLLTFFVVAILGRVEHPQIPSTSKHLATDLISVDPAQAKALLRLLTPVVKALTAKLSITGLQECMECLGGLGYLEHEGNQDINIARLLRDANVLSIWEGTTDVLASDVVRVLKGRDGEDVLHALGEWVGKALDSVASTIAQSNQALQEFVKQIRKQWVELKESILNAGREELLASGRDVLIDLSGVVCGVLLLVDAASDRDIVAEEICRRFMEQKFGSLVTGRAGDVKAVRAYKMTLEMDRSIAFGETLKTERSKL